MFNDKNTIDRRSFLKRTGIFGAATIFGSLFPRVSQSADKTVLFQNVESDPATIKFLDKLISEYKQKTGTNIKMEHLPVGGEAFQKVLAGIKAGRSYDIVNLGQLVYVVNLASAGHLVPLTKLVKEQGEEDFGPMSLWEINNEYYYYPYDYNFVSAFYRKDWLDLAEREPARTWDEFVEIAKRFTKKGRYGLIYPCSMHDTTNWAGTNILWSNDVHIYDKNWNVILDSAQMKPKVVDSLEFLKELNQYMPKGVFQAKYGDLTNAFTTGTVGITFYAGRLIHHLERYAPTLSEQYIMAGFPTPDGKKQAVTHATDGWIVLNKGRATQEAVETMRWLVNDKIIGFLLTLALHYQPVRKSIYNNPSWKNNDLVKKHDQAVKQMETYLDPEKTIINSLDTEGPELSVKQSKVWSAYVIPEMYQNVLLKKMKPSKAVDIASEKIRKLIA